MTYFLPYRLASIRNAKNVWNDHESYVKMNLVGDSHWLLAFGIHPQVRQKEGIFSGNVVLCSIL